MCLPVIVSLWRRSELAHCPACACHSHPECRSCPRSSSRIPWTFPNPAYGGGCLGPPSDRICRPRIHSNGMSALGRPEEKFLLKLRKRRLVKEYDVKRTPIWKRCIPSFVLHQGKSDGVVTIGMDLLGSSHPSAGTLPLRRISSPIRTSAWT